MLIAKQKRKENIAEYILYLYQVEDLVRAFKLDMDLIRQRLVASYKTDEATKEEIADWYRNLVIMMEKEGKSKKGHLQFLLNLVTDLNDFHLKLMETGEDAVYRHSFTAASTAIAELKQKNPEARGDVDLGISAVYGFLLLKMQQKEISAATTEAIRQISTWLGALSKIYRDFEKGEFSFQ